MKMGSAGLNNLFLLDQVKGHCAAYAAKDIKVLQNRTRVGWDAFEAGGYFRGRAPLLEQPAPFLSDTWVSASWNNQQVLRNQTRLTWQSCLGLAKQPTISEKSDFRVASLNKIWDRRSLTLGWYGGCGSHWTRTCSSWNAKWSFHFVTIGHPWNCHYHLQSIIIHHYPLSSY